MRLNCCELEADNQAFQNQTIKGEDKELTQMVCGYIGNILRVDLTNGNTSIEEPGEDFYRRYLGGTGLISYYLLKEQRPGVDPFSLENKLIFATGVVTGAPLGGSGRNAVGTKSPLSNAFCSSVVGGYWGSELKRAGYDALIIEGKAEKPVYLWIQDGNVEIKDATHLWGKLVADTQEMIKRELGDSGVRIASIGPAGENLVRFANIVCDLGHFAGRRGTGAVMGSKKLKAIAIRGHNTPPMADPKAIGDLAKWYRDQVQAHPILMEMHSVGTIGGLVGYSKVGGLAAKNFQEGTFSEVEKLSPEAYVNELGSGMDTCYACPVRCKHKVTIKEPHHYGLDLKYYIGHGPEYQCLACFGPLCGVSDLQAIACANELCSAYGMDVVSCGATIAFAMECFERGLLTEKDFGGLQLKFGNADAMVKAVNMICKRKDFGDVLAEGSFRAAQKIGKGAEQYVMHSKGVELPMHSPHYKPVMGLGYAVCPSGSDHVRNLVFIHILDAERQADPRIRELLSGFTGHYKSLGLLAPVYRSRWSDPASIRTLVYASIQVNMLDCLGLCHFAAQGMPHAKIAEIVRGVVGWDTNVWELMKAGERAMNMMRVFNLREGFTREDDHIPERFHQPRGTDPLEESKLDKKEFEKAKDVYYGMMSWDQLGNPTRAKLQELDIEWVAD